MDHQKTYFNPSYCLLWWPLNRWMRSKKCSHCNAVTTKSKQWRIFFFVLAGNKNERMSTNTVHIRIRVKRSIITVHCVNGNFMEQILARAVGHKLGQVRQACRLMWITCNEERWARDNYLWIIDFIHIARIFCRCCFLLLLQRIEKSIKTSHDSSDYHRIEKQVKHTHTIQWNRWSA